MHPNPIFHSQNSRRDLGFARDRGFGVLAANGTDGPLLAHVPFMISKDGTQADLHLMRANPIARQKAPVAATIAVSGPDSYVSPDWYDLPDQVPTWNYVAVHLKGTFETRPTAELRALLDREAGFFEDKLLPKPPWHSAKMTPEVLERMMRMIVPCRFHIISVAATWKLGQNKPDAARQNAADHIDAHGLGVDAPVMAALMRGV